MIKYAMPVVFGDGFFMVKILAETKRVRLYFIKPGIIGRWTVLGAVPVQLRQRTLSIAMIGHHIQDHRDLFLVTGIDKFLQFVFGPIIFIRREIK